MTLSRTRRVALALAIIVVGAQFVRPDRSNPPVDGSRTIQATATVPASIDVVLRRACYDCHSSETRWPWYSSVAPMSWAVADHVQDGRAVFNLSEWGSYPQRKRAAVLEKMCDEVREHRMPLAQYLWLHPEARLSEQDWKSICDWSMGEADRPAAGR